MRQLGVIQDKQALSAAEIAQEEYFFCGPSQWMCLFILCLSQMTRAVLFWLFQKTVILPPNPVGFRLTYTQLWDIFFIRYINLLELNTKVFIFFSHTRVL